MTSLARNHEFRFRHSDEVARSRPNLEAQAQEARDVDDASPEDIILNNPRGVAVGIVLALGALGLGVAAGLGYIHAPALNPGPQPEPLTSHWQLDPQLSRDVVRQAAHAKLTGPPATAAHTAAEGPEASRADVTNPTAVPPASVPNHPESRTSHSELGTTDNPY